MALYHLFGIKNCKKLVREELKLFPKMVFVIQSFPGPLEAGIFQAGLGLLGTGS